MTSSRITITIPGPLVEEADRRAAEVDRSRSWVLVEALRSYLAGPEVERPAGHGPTPATAVREPSSPYIVPGLGPGRLAQLRADLSLEPAERVRVAEETARSGPASTREPDMDQVISFHSIEDFHRWERREALGRAVPDR